MSEPDTDERKVSWVELFFDLVFVYAVTRTAEMLRDDASAPGIARAAIAFVPVYWTWVGTTMLANLRGVDRQRDRIGVLGVALTSLFMAIALPEAWHGSGLLFAGAYWAGRLVLLCLVARGPLRRAFTSFTVAACLTGPLLVCGALVTGAPRAGLWALAAAIDLSVPMVVRSRLASVPFDAGHLTERFATLVIIALGETVVSTAGGAEHGRPDQLVAVALAFVVTCGLWWVYFAFGPGTIEQQLRASSARIEIIRPVLSYGHLCLAGGIIAVASAIGRGVDDPREPLATPELRLLLGGVVLYLLTFAATRWRMLHTLAVPRLTASAACLVLVPLGVHLPARTTFALLGAILVALNLVEHWVLPRTLRNARSNPPAQGHGMPDSRHEEAHQ